MATRNEVTTTEMRDVKSQNFQNSQCQYYTSTLNKVQYTIYST